MNFNTLDKIIKIFWVQCLPLIAKHSVLVSEQSIGIKKIENRSRFSLYKPIYLTGIPQRHNSPRRKPRLTIFVDFDGRLEDDVVVSTCTRVVYTCAGDPRKPLEINLIKGVRYDFDSDSELLHPVCHAQEDITMMRDTLIGSDFNVVNMEEAIKFHRDSLCHLNTMRVPTALMDFFSTIMMILSDHCLAPDNVENVRSYNELMGTIIGKVKTVDVCSDFLHAQSTLRNLNYFQFHAANHYVTQSKAS